jgi:hypothetical protein
MRAREKRKWAEIRPPQDDTVNGYWQQTARNLGILPQALVIREFVL